MTEEHLQRQLDEIDVSPVSDIPEQHIRCSPEPASLAFNVDPVLLLTRH